MGSKINDKKFVWFINMYQSSPPVLFSLTSHKSTVEEMICQRMTHIAVERNSRKKKNEHLRVLKYLMNGSYGDQVLTIGGAIKFKRELEQLLHCLKSQKRTTANRGHDHDNDFFFTNTLVGNQLIITGNVTELEGGGGGREETGENKSVLGLCGGRAAGFDAMIKIHSGRRSGQLIKTIAADLHDA
ncbi:hypothetical protein YC2023_061287 [Brassica napus]